MVTTLVLQSEIIDQQQYNFLSANKYFRFFLGF